jgi:hypothetical protein
MVRAQARRRLHGARDLAEPLGERVIDAVPNQNPVVADADLSLPPSSSETFMIVPVRCCIDKFIGLGGLVIQIQKN